ncbi:hypothetical protein H6F75_00660 [Nodosilinea sp. FACHB-131]|uniref:hypothetical protein n=1 Tax=Cyanophyceae TaxID=3028117 RepID=UPI001687CD84|nr:hypothetical protein [Nodosilinea sp. FACHB-131]MBD1871982.1 hypothetical protein [Nodosilinea sp. FACHB-131]
MLLNRILTAIQQWIVSVGWYHEGEVKQKPYETIHTHRVEGKGIILLVKRNPDQCPRDVGTIIWLPVRGVGTDTQDCHICVDHLEGMARTKERHTHQVTIAAASHWPDRNGLFDYDTLYAATADLQGQQSRRDLNVRKVLTVLAQPLAYQSAIDVNWELQLGIAMKSAGLSAPKVHGTVVARSLDGGPGVRINLDG